MISPAPATTTYYKVGQNITFMWNYTSLLVPPSAIDVLVSNTVSTYTLTQNASVQATGVFVWDTEQYAGRQNPLVNAFYTLAVVDADAGAAAVPSPGHLGAYGNNAPFGIYATQTATVSNSEFGPIPLIIQLERGSRMLIFVCCSIHVCNLQWSCVCKRETDDDLLIRNGGPYAGFFHLFLQQFFSCSLTLGLKWSSHSPFRS